MSYVMKILTANVRGRQLVLSPDVWLKSFDVDAHGGLGSMVTTHKQTEAMRFTNHAEAYAAWKAQSRVRPLRDDGLPNRPLSGCTVEIAPLEVDE